MTKSRRCWRYENSTISWLAHAWVLATLEYNILTESSGPGFGISLSHKAEGYELHAGAQFVSHLFAFFHVPVPKLTIACDNSGIIPTLSKQINYRVRFPKYYLQPDADQVSAILDIVLPNYRDSKFWNALAKESTNIHSTTNIWTLEGPHSQCSPPGGHHISYTFSPCSANNRPTTSPSIVVPQRYILSSHGQYVRTSNCYSAQELAPSP